MGRESDSGSVREGSSPSSPAQKAPCKPLLREELRLCSFGKVLAGHGLNAVGATPVLPDRSRQPESRPGRCGQATCAARRAEGRPRKGSRDMKGTLTPDANGSCKTGSRDPVLKRGMDCNKRRVTLLARLNEEHPKYHKAYWASRLRGRLRPGAVTAPALGQVPQPGCRLRAFLATWWAIYSRVAIARTADVSRNEKGRTSPMG